MEENNRVDAAMVEAAQRGDRAAFEALFRQYGPPVLGYFRKRPELRHRADDLLQETFLRALQKLPDLRDPQAFPAWLRKITRSVCSNHRRRPRPEVPFSPEAGDSVDYQPLFGSPPPSSEKRAATKRCRKALLAALQELPTRRRLIATLRWIYGRSYKRIAAALEIDVGNVGKQVHLAKKAVAPKIHADCADLETAWDE